MAPLAVGQKRIVSNKHGGAMSGFQNPQKVALVTGASSGIGRVTARELALQGYLVFLACRSEEKTRLVQDEIARVSKGAARAEFLPLDLGNLASVRQCAKQFLDRGLPLHLLIANAGLAGQRGMTDSGFETTFGVCHVGHFLLTRLLLGRLKAAAPARIVVVASHIHRKARAIDFASLRRPMTSVTGLPEYAVAKLANVLFVSELARRLAGTGVTSYALHPGVVATDVWRKVPWPIDRIIKPFMLSEEKGAATTLYCSTAPELASESGFYYENCARRTPSELSQNTDLAAQLWNETEAWIDAPGAA